MQRQFRIPLLSLVLFTLLLAPLAARTADAASACLEMAMPAAALKTVGRGFSSYHKGIDLLAPYGSPVRAAAPGTVVMMQRWGGYGNLVEVQHTNGVSTRYAHLSRFAPGLHVGSKVDTGTLVGLVGATGRATTPHLHFEVRVGGTAVNPAPSIALASCTAPALPRDTIEVARAPDPAAAEPRARRSHRR